MTEHLLTITRTECPLCTSDHIFPDLVVDQTIIFKCSECEFIFPAIIPNSEVLQNMYNYGYSDDRIRNGQYVNARTNLRLLHVLVGNLSKLKILDVGSGYGFLPSLLQSSCNARCDGLEISLIQNKYANERLNVKTYHDFDQLSSRYDLICAFEVIEHIPYPLPFLERLVSFLNPGGHLVIGTDNFQSKAVSEMGSAFPKWIPDEHVSCFSPASMDYLLRSISCLQNSQTMTYEPWEMLAFRAVYRIKTLLGAVPAHVPSAKLSSKVIQSGSYKFFHLRKLLNPHWAPSSLSSSSLGEMMISHSRRST